MQNSDFWTRITSLYGSKAWPVVCACTTACLASELQFSMGSRPHLSFCACKTAWLAPELLVSLGSSPHLWNKKSLLVPDITSHFVNAIQRDYHRNDKSIWVPALICGFCMQYSDFWSRITSLYGSQTSPVVLCMQYSVISIGMTCLYGVQPRSVVLWLQNSDFRTRHTSLYGSQTSSVVLSTHSIVLSTRNKRLY